MLRWAIRAIAANKYKNKVISESSRASRKSSDAVNSFKRANREKDLNKKITLLDIGSGFDPIFSEKTRPKQPSAEKCFMYYKKVLPSDYKFKKTSHAVNSLNKMLTNF